MDPIEKLASKSKKIMMNKDNMIMKPGNANSSQDNFFRKTASKQFPSGGISKSEAYGTIIQIMKSDISQVQEMINEYSYITKMFKLSSKSSFTSKRINEIGDTSDIKSFIDKIVEESSSADKLSRVYNCQNANDLILKMGLELNMYDNFVKKLNDLFFILNLKLHGEENSSALSQENFSKFFVIKIVLEKMIEKSSTTYINDTDTSMNSSQNNFNNTFTKSSRSGFGKFGDENLKSSSNNNNENNSKTLSDSDKRKFEDFEKIKNCANINDLLNIDQDLEIDKEENQFNVIMHLSSIIKDFLSKVSIGYNDLIKKYSSKKDLINPDCSIKFNKPNLSIEGFLSQRLSIEKILMEKEKQISSNSVNLTSVPVNNNKNNE